MHWGQGVEKHRYRRLWVTAVSPDLSRKGKRGIQTMHFFQARLTGDSRSRVFVKRSIITLKFEHLVNGDFLVTEDYLLALET